MTKQYFKKPFFAHGSVFWLAQNQIMREFRTRKNNAGAKALLGRIAFFCFLGFVCFTVGQGLVEFIKSAPADFNELKLVAGQKLFTAFAALFFMSLMSSFMYLTDRSDLDLLLSAPIAANRVVASRLMAGTWRTILIFALFSTMFVGLAAVTISAKYFSYIPVAIGLAFLEAGLTFFAARFALLSLGLRRGRIFVQIIGAIGIIGGAILMQPKTRPAQAIINGEIGQTQLIFPSQINEFLTWWGGSLLGDFVPALATLVFGVLVFAIMISFAGRSFAHDVAFIAGQNDGALNKPSTKKLFKSKLWQVMLLKELRSITRDPTAIVQLIAPFAGVLPAVIGIYSQGEKINEMIGYIGAPMLIFLSGSLSSSLAWLIISVEEANDLLRTSPTSSKKVFIAKSIAALLPAFIEVAIFSAIIGYFSAKAGIIAFTFGVLANLSIVAIEFARPKPAKRPKMMQKPDRSISAIIFGLVVTLVWSVAAGVANFSLLWSLIPIGLGIALTMWAIFDAPEIQEDAARPVWVKTKA